MGTQGGGGGQVFLSPLLLHYSNIVIRSTSGEQPTALLCSLFFAMCCSHKNRHSRVISLVWPHLKYAKLVIPAGSIL